MSRRMGLFKMVDLGRSSPLQILQALQALIAAHFSSSESGRTSDTSHGGNENVRVVFSNSPPKGKGMVERFIATGRRPAGLLCCVKPKHARAPATRTPSQLTQNGMLKPPILALRTEAEAMHILKATSRDPVAVHLCMLSGGANTLRVALRQRAPVEARQAIATLFGAIRPVKHIFVFDEDIDIRDEGQVAWAMGTRFQADEDIVVLQGMMGMTMDPSLKGRRTGAKAGFDCTMPFGRADDIPLDPLRRPGLCRPGTVPVSRGRAGRRTDVLRRHCRRDRQRRWTRSRHGARPAAAGRPPGPRPRRPLSPWFISAWRHRHPRVSLP
jgi:hypothetical protein